MEEIEIKDFKIVIKTRYGYDRFEFVMAESEEEVRRVYEETLKKGEKIISITED